MSATMQQLKDAVASRLEKRKEHAAAITANGVDTTKRRGLRAELSTEIKEYRKKMRALAKEQRAAAKAEKKASKSKPAAKVESKTPVAA